MLDYLNNQLHPLGWVGGDSFRGGYAVVLWERDVTGETIIRLHW